MAKPDRAGAVVPNFDEYFPFDKGFGASANSARWRKMAQLWCPDGVLLNYPAGLPAVTQLFATIASGTVTINPGAAFIHGYYAEVLAAQNVTSVSGNGTIVAGVDLVNEICSIYYKSGATDYSGYTQSLTLWEIPLWLVTGGTTLTDLRTFVTGGQGVTWAGRLDGPVSIATGTTSPLVMAQFLVARVPYAGWAKIEGNALITFTDLSTDRTASCQLSYQQGVAGQAQLAPTTPMQPGNSAWGAGMALQTLAMPIALSGTIPVTTGLKTAGWLVSAGTGPGIQVSNMTLSMRLIDPGATA
jgi:hypothetical protein